MGNHILSGITQGLESFLTDTPLRGIQQRDEIRDLVKNIQEQPPGQVAQSQEFQRLSALDPVRASKIGNLFGNIGTQREKALFDDAREVRTRLEGGDVQGALNILNQRVSILGQMGGDPSDTLEIANDIQSGNAQGALQKLLLTEKVGVQQGILTDLSAAQRKREGRKTSSARDFEQFQGLLQSARLETDPELKRQKEIQAEQFGRQARFIKPSEQQSADIKVNTAERKEIAKASIKRKQGFIDSGVDAADSTANIRRSIDLLDFVKTGGIDAALLRAKQIFGIESANEAELSSGLGKAILAQLRPIFGAAFTAAEGERLERIEAQFGKSTEGNKRLLKQVLRIAERASKRGLAAAEDQGDEFTAGEIRKALAFKLENKDFSAQVQPTQQVQPQQAQLGQTSDEELRKRLGL